MALGWGRRGGAIAAAYTGPNDRRSGGEGAKEGFYGYEKTPVRSDSYSLRFSLRRKPRGTHIISSSVISRHRLAVLRLCSCVYVRYCVYSTGNSRLSGDPITRIVVIFFDFGILFLQTPSNDIAKNPLCN